MTVKVIIADGTGTGRTAEISDQLALVVSDTGCPPLVRQKNRVFRQYMTDDGTATGSEDMKVDGSATAVEFWIAADNDDDRYITTLSFVIADANAVLNKFGNVAALTNGCHLYYETPAQNVDIHTALKSNFDFVRLCLGAPAFALATTAFRAGNVVGTSEGYIPVLDLRQLVPPFGIKLDRGTTQRLALKVRDDCTGVDGFDCIAYGFDRFE
jgi:hypothetical protein